MLAGSAGMWCRLFSLHCRVARSSRHWQVGGHILDAHTMKMKEDKVKTANMVTYLDKE